MEVVGVKTSEQAKPSDLFDSTSPLIQEEFAPQVGETKPDVQINAVFDKINEHTAELRNSSFSSIHQEDLEKSLIKFKNYLNSEVNRKTTTGDPVKTAEELLHTISILLDSGKDVKEKNQALISFDKQARNSMLSEQAYKIASAIVGGLVGILFVGGLFALMAAVPAITPFVVTSLPSIVTFVTGAIVSAGAAAVAGFSLACANHKKKVEQAQHGEVFSKLNTLKCLLSERNKCMHPNNAKEQKPEHRESLPVSYLSPSPKLS